jgi:uncharacterized protein involved in tolerance to divalent cations
MVTDISRFITDKSFMDEFKANSEACYNATGDFKGVYEIYEDILTDDEIETLLKTVENDLNI